MADSVFVIQETCLKIVSLRRLIELKLKSLNLLFFAFYFFSLLYAILSASKFIFENTQDVIACADASGALCTGIISLSKLTSFLIFNEEFYQIIDQLKLMALNCKGSELNKVKSVNKLNRFVSTRYLGSTLTAGWGYLLRPVIINLVKFYRDENFYYEMPFKTSFPYEITTPLPYTLSYIMYGFATLSSGFTSVRDLIYLIKYDKNIKKYFSGWC